MSKSEIEFYNLGPILEKKCQYNIIIGERSNGKTYSVLERILRKWVDKGEQGAYIRRWKEDYRGKRGTQLFSGHTENGFISTLTNGEWDCVKYYSGKWYLAKKDEEMDRLITQDEPFCFAFALSDMEHDKSTSYPLVTTVVFDEFLTRGYYLPDEFVIFMNVLSTIIRHRDNVLIFMLGNTVNKYAPYFKEMGLRHISEMEKGKIDVYSYGDSALKVAVEYCKSPSKNGKKSDLYFAFDNPSLSMITGGAWEIDIYPHNPRKFTPSNIIFTFFINFNDCLLQGEIVKLEDCHYLYFHQKTTPIHDEDHDIIFSEIYDPRPNHFRNIRKGTSKLVQKLSWYFRNDKVFYQDNEIGEVVRNYLQYCQSEGR
jgi:hypothetical protein